MRYLHTDALGSPVAETNETGSVVKRTRYEPYGAPTDGIYLDGPGYTGHVTDEATRLTYMQQRFYDPLAGRFLSLDPVTTDPNTGVGFNRYAYANNNPYRFVDPDGREEKDLTEKGNTCSRVGSQSCSGSYGSQEPGNASSRLRSANSNTDRMAGKKAVEAVVGATEGAVSVARGTYRAGRQVLRSTGLLGNDEYEDFNIEGKLADEIVKAYIGNSEFRGVINDGVVQGIKSIEGSPHNIG